MKRNFLFLFLFFFLLFPNPISAATKEDIIHYVSEKEEIICDQKTKTLFQSYRLLFTRMLKEKELSETDLDSVLSKVKEAVSLIEKNNICKKSDFGNISGDLKQQVKDLLYDGMMIIYEAKALNQESSQKTPENAIVIDKNNQTIDIYQNGNLYDKVELSEKTFNYVGPNPIILKSLWILSGLCLLSLMGFLLLKNKLFPYHRILSDICFSVFLFTFFVTPFFYLGRGKVEKFLTLSSMFKNPIMNVTPKPVLIDENHEILSYPAYGDTYATLTISNRSISVPVKFGDSKDLLQDSIGHTTTSFLPGEGGTILYSGHNNSSILGNLKNVAIGDLIEVETSYGTFTYQVGEIRTMGLDQYDQITISSERESLVLYTCYPFSSVLYGNERFVVFSNLVKEEWKNK